MDLWRMRAFCKGLLFLLVYRLSVTEGEIRCYCNESGCATTGYMCKSQLGLCYSLVKPKDDLQDPTTQTVVHGCADNLEQEPRIRTCAQRPEEIAEDSGSKENTTDSEIVTNTVEVEESVVVENVGREDFTTKNDVGPIDPVLTCCTQDMCNYKNSWELSIFIEGTGDASSSTDGISSKRTEGSERPQKDLWFKAAVIAVPIAGGFILILLVLLAVRMLRSDSRQHRRLIQIRRERSLTKAQLYVTDHFIDKDKKQILSDNSHSHQNHSHSQTSNRHNPCDAHRNCNNSQHSHHHKHGHHKVTINKDGHTYEQILSPNSDVISTPNCDTSCTSQHSKSSQHSSVVVWGKQKETDLEAAVV